MGYKGPLQLAPGELADACVGKSLRVYGCEHLVYELAPPTRRKRHAETVPVDAEPHEVTRPQGHVRVEVDPLGDIADGTVAPLARSARDLHRARRRHLESEDHLEHRRLARPVRADEAGELPRAHSEADLVEDLAPGEDQRHALEREHLLPAVTGLCRGAHKRSVEILSATAFRRALTSASIQVW